MILVAILKERVVEATGENDAHSGGLPRIGQGFEGSCIACSRVLGISSEHHAIMIGGGEIDVENHVIDDFTFGEQTRIADDVGNA